MKNKDQTKKSIFEKAACNHYDFLEKGKKKGGLWPELEGKER
jgi:hypothetical protein